MFWKHGAFSRVVHGWSAVSGTLYSRLAGAAAWCALGAWRCQFFFAMGKKRLKFAAWCFRKQCGLYIFVSSAPLALKLGQHLYRTTGYMCGEWRRLNRSAR